MNRRPRPDRPEPPGHAEKRIEAAAIREAKSPAHVLARLEDVERRLDALERRP